MTPVDRGRFCASCQKKVFDFTRSTDREILEKFIADQNICGRFRSSQLDRDLSVPKEKTPLWTAAAAGVLTLLNYHDAPAQTQQSTEQTVSYYGETIGKVAPPKNSETQVSTGSKTVSGVVSDATGTIPGVNVVVKGTTRTTQTDIDGKYAIAVSTGEILVFSFIGMRTQELTVADRETLDIRMDVTMDSKDLVMLGGPMLARKRSWFGRAFVWIGNRFRSEDERISCKYK